MQKLTHNRMCSIIYTIHISFFSFQDWISYTKALYMNKIINKIIENYIKLKNYL